MRSLELISTDTVQPSDRICLFRDTLWNLFGRLESKAISRAPFMASFEYATVGGVRLCRLKASGHRVERPSAKYSDGYVKMALQLKGTVYFNHAGRDLIQPPGQWTLFDTAKPYLVTAPNGSETLMFLLPRDTIVSKRYNFQDLILRPFSATVGIGKLASEFICSVFKEVPNLDPQSEPEISDTIAHLVRLTMMEAAGDRAIRSQREVLSERIRSYIHTQLRNPNLSIDHIAQALNCTKRYLHKAFEGEGVSISDYIWHLRLERSREELLNPKWQAKSITDVAFSWGFNSSAHFSAAFRERFGTSPSRYRTEEQAVNLVANVGALVSSQKN